MPTECGANIPGTIYLVHFAVPFRHARHYLGWTHGNPHNVLSRLRYHLTGRGSRLLAAVAAAGIPIALVRLWPDMTRHDERRMKVRGLAPRCPLCMLRKPPRGRCNRQSS